MNKTMGKAIEVYLKSVAVPVGIEEAYYLICSGHECTRKPAAFAKVDRVLSEADRSLFDVVRTVAKEKGEDVRVYDLSTFRGRFMARLKGVHSTPTVIIDNHRIEGAITKDRLLQCCE